MNLILLLVVLLVVADEDNVLYINTLHFAPSYATAWRLVTLRTLLAVAVVVVVPLARASGELWRITLATVPPTNAVSTQDQRNCTYAARARTSGLGPPYCSCHKASISSLCCCAMLCSTCRSPVRANATSGTKRSAASEKFMRGTVRPSVSRALHVMMPINWPLLEPATTVS